MKQASRYITAMTMALAMACAAIVLAGCVSPGAIAPPARKIDVTPAPDAPASVEVADTWWKAFGDERLNALVERALQSNPDLATARARIERAAAVADAAEAARKPRIDGSAEITRE
ncbi:MAG TPA: TolC family protein, partial [Burkholderiaceae bacterium]